VAASRQEFVDRVGRALAAPGTPGDREARRTLARRHDWSAKAAEFARLLGCGEPRAGTRPCAPQGHPPMRGEGPAPLSGSGNDRINLRDTIAINSGNRGPAEPRMTRWTSRLFCK
jgi:hypothetical protein